MKTFLTIIIVCLIHITTYSQTYKINLAKKVGEITPVTVAPFTLETIILENRLIAQGIKYECSIEILEKKIPPLSTDAFKGSTLPTAVNDSCPRLKILTDSLKTAKDESIIPTKIERLNNEIKIVQANNPSPLCNNAIKTAQEMIKGTEEKIVLPEPIELDNTNQIRITIRRDSEHIWTVILSTGDESPWEIFYGVTYIPNWMNPITNYYAMQSNDTSFIITPLNNQRKDFLSTLTPTIMFTWHSLAKPGSGCSALLNNRFYQVGFMGGLGLNMSNPILMVGPSIIIGDNISLNGGVVFTQKDVLSGGFKAGQIIKQNLDFNSLHEKKYLPEWFISIGFRFDKNPFSAGTKEEKPKEGEEKKSE